MSFLTFTILMLSPIPLGWGKQGAVWGGVTSWKLNQDRKIYKLEFFLTDHLIFTILNNIKVTIESQRNMFCKEVTREIIGDPTSLN